MLDLWLAMFHGLDDPSLAAAIVAHIGDPEAGRYFPTPADILRCSRPPARDHAATWEAILARIARGRYELADLLDPTEARALASIGGSWEIRMADTDSKLPRLRKRFLAACKGDPVAHRAVEARESFRALPGGRDGGR